MVHFSLHELVCTESKGITKKQNVTRAKVLNVMRQMFAFTFCGRVCFDRRYDILLCQMYSTSVQKNKIYRTTV